MAADRQRPVALTITAEGLGYGYGGHSVHLNGELIGHRPYDGASADEVCDETARALAEMLREKLGWEPKEPEEEEW
jgi:hypothetical protein